MSYFFASLSQRCNSLRLRRILTRKAVTGTLLSASVVGCVQLHRKDVTLHSRVFHVRGQSLLLPWFPKAAPRLNRVTWMGAFCAKFSNFQGERSFENFAQISKLCGARSRRAGRHNLSSKANGQSNGKELREKKIFTVPNALCFGRIVASPFLAYLVLSESYQAALAVFILAGFTDMLDGFIARRFPSQMSYLGSVLDPIADKILVGVLTVTLTLVHLIPVPLAVVILGRDVGLIMSSFVVRYISLPQPRTLARFFDFQLPTVEVTPSVMGKLNTALQLALITLSLTAPVLDFTDHASLIALQYVVGITTVISGVDYMISRRGFNILTKN